MNNVIQQAIDVWKPDFLVRFLKLERHSHATTWKFWIITSVIAALLGAIFIVGSMARSAPELIDNVSSLVPDGAKIIMNDGVLHTENIEEPFVYEAQDANEHTGEDESFIIIIDTHGAGYGIEDIQNYDSAFLVLSDRVYSKDKNEIDTLAFEKSQDFSITKEQALEKIENFKGAALFIFGLIVFAGLTFFFGAVRLLIAFWWTLLFFLIALIFGCKERFMTLYYAVLNFYFIPLVIEGALIILGLSFKFSTTLIFGVIFIINLFVWHKTKKEEEQKTREGDAQKEDVGKLIPATNPSERNKITLN